MTIHSPNALVSASQPAGYPLVPIPEMSRRTFIKLLGIVVAEATFELSPAGRVASTFTRTRAARSDPPIPAAIGLLLRRAIEELREQGFPFDLEQASVVSIPDQPHLIGMMLQDIRLPPRQDGANIALTIDTRSPQRSILFYVIGRSNSEGLEITSAVLPVGGERCQRHDRFPRTGIAVQQGPAICPTRYVVNRDGPILKPPGSSTASAGWKESTHWYYDHSRDAMWLGGQDSALQLGYTSCQEYRNCRDSSASHAGCSRGWYSEIRKMSLEGV